MNALDEGMKAFERVASTAERVGIPTATFAIGATTVGLSAKVPIEILPWLGTGLILASLGTYIWLTARSTIKVQLPPPPIPTELQAQLDWMRTQIDTQNTWIRNLAQRQAFGPETEEAEQSKPERPGIP